MSIQAAELVADVVVAGVPQAVGQLSMFDAACAVPRAGADIDQALTSMPLM